MSQVTSPSGSENPASSLSALMAHIRIVLDRIVRTPANGNVIRANYASYMSVHSACYEYLNKDPRPGTLPRSVASGSDIYQQIDAYFADIVRQIAIEAPEDDTDIIPYITSTFHRFSSSARSAEKLLSYLHRHYIKRAIEGGKGWLRYDYALEFALKPPVIKESLKALLIVVDKRKIDDLKIWGHQSDVSREQAEQYAEAASSLDCVVPISSVAYRRFRTEFMEQFVGENINSRSKLPDSCLSRAVLGSKNPDIAQFSLLRDLYQTLRTIGVRPMHPLCIQIDRIIHSGALPAGKD